MGSSFTEVIDMTRRAQRQRRLEDDESLLEEPEPRLPEVNLEELPTVIQQAATAMGWDELTPVQAMAIPYLREKRDLIVQAQTGTGKTGAFLLPLMEQLDPDFEHVQALVINPTRELARQTFEEFMKMKAGSPDSNQMYGAIVYGGVGYKKQIEDMKKADIVVGTPGRLLDHLKKGNLELDRLRHLIIDEADELLSMGFYPDIEEIINEFTPSDRHSSLYSATVPYRIQLMAEEFLVDPGYLSLSEEQVHADKITHQYVVVPRLEKDDALVEMIEDENPESALIFANTKRDVRYVARFLQNKGYDADQISGDLPQNEREKVMGRIRDGELRFLVATDVAARGIDISDLSHVFLYDVPQDREFYIHRSGRTARAGQSGTVIVLATINEKADLKEISSHYDIDFERRELPSHELEGGEESEREAGDEEPASTEGVSSVSEETTGNASSEPSPGDPTFKNPDEAPEGLALRRKRASRTEEPSGKPDEPSDELAEKTGSARADGSREAEGSRETGGPEQTEATSETEPSRETNPSREPEEPAPARTEPESGTEPTGETESEGSGEETDQDVEATRPTDSDADTVRDRAAEALESWLFARERSSEKTWKEFVPLAERFTREAKTRHLAMILEEWVDHHVSEDDRD